MMKKSTLTFMLLVALAGCASPRGHETDALGASLGKAGDSAAATGKHIQSAQKTTQQIDDELQELLRDSALIWITL